VDLFGLGWEFRAGPVIVSKLLGPYSVSEHDMSELPDRPGGPRAADQSVPMLPRAFRPQLAGPPKLDAQLGLNERRTGARCASPMDVPSAHAGQCPQMLPTVIRSPVHAGDSPLQSAGVLVIWELLTVTAVSLRPVVLFPSCSPASRSGTRRSRRTMEVYGAPVRWRIASRFS